MPLFVESNTSSLIEIDGPDARDFLQRLTTVNFNTLREGESASGFFLNAQGKIQAFFGITCENEKLYTLDCPRGEGEAWKNALLTTIDRFTFAEKLTLKEIPCTHAYIVGEDSETVRSEARQLGLRLIDWKKTLFGVPTVSIFGEKSKLDSLKTKFKTGSPSDLEKLRIENTRPGVDHEITLESNPLEIAMKSAIADQKGCYPGQEVIEKIIALGSPARGLVQISGALPAPKLGDKTCASDGAEIGKVTSILSTGTGFTALSIVRKTHLKTGIEVRFPESASSGQIRAIAENQTP